MEMLFSCIEYKTNHKMYFCERGLPQRQQPLIITSSLQIKERENKVNKGKEKSQKMEDKMRELGKQKTDPMKTKSKKWWMFT